MRSEDIQNQAWKPGTVAGLCTGSKPNRRLKMCMFEMGLRQKDLAGKLDISESKMSHIVTGLTAPDVYEAQRIPGRWRQPWKNCGR